MNSPIDIKVTPEGLEKLKKEQEELIAKRPGVVDRMVAAREQGDLSENAGFHAARDELARIDSRLRELKLIIKFAQIISSDNSSFVGLGTNVIVDDGTGQKEFKIVGKLEADPEKGLVSNESPIGKALVGKKAGESVTIDVPDGKVVYKIINIKS